MFTIFLTFCNIKRINIVYVNIIKPHTCMSECVKEYESSHMEYQIRLQKGTFNKIIDQLDE